MGSSITVALMKADRKIKQDFDKIPRDRLDLYNLRQYSPYSLEDLRNIQESDYNQLSENSFYHYQTYGKHWCNGAFLTLQGYMFLKRVCQIVEQYHYVDSDIQTDYYNTNFYFHLQLGKWDKPFMDGQDFIEDKELFKLVEDTDKEIKEYFEKQEEEKRRKQDEANQYKKLIKPSVPTGATHVIDGSGFRELTREERETGHTRDELNKRWFHE